MEKIWNGKKFQPSQHFLTFYNNNRWEILGLSEYDN